MCLARGLGRITQLYPIKQESISFFAIIDLNVLFSEPMNSWYEPHKLRFTVVLMCQPTTYMEQVVFDGNLIKEQRLKRSRRTEGNLSQVEGSV